MTYFIYKYTFPNGKVYIGQTKKGTDRINKKSAYKGQVVYNAMNKYKIWDTEILLECPETLADWWETSMIKIHDSMNPEKGYNRESGGNKNKHMSAESRKKMSENYKYHTNGIKHRSEETKRKISENNKRLASELNGASVKCRCIETDEIFSCIRDAGRKYNISFSHITAVCKGKRKTCGGYHWEYID